MKPLYLYGTDRLSVVLDGPALRVTKASCADRRVPLERVSRVVVSGLVSWSTEALLECADRGIAICFLKADGTPRARWIGRSTKRSDLVQCWLDLLDRPDWEERYVQWQVATARRAVRFCALRMGWSPEKDVRSMNHAICQATRAVATVDEMRAIRKKLHGLTVSRALQALDTAGLAADGPALSHLLPDLASAVQWGLRPDLIRWLADRRRGRNRLAMATDPHAVALFFERHRSVSDFHLQDILGRLYRYLEGLL